MIPTNWVHISKVRLFVGEMTSLTEEHLAAAGYVPSGDENSDEWRAFHKNQADHFREALWKIGYGTPDCWNSGMAKAARKALDTAPKTLETVGGLLKAPSDCVYFVNGKAYASSGVLIGGREVLGMALIQGDFNPLTQSMWQENQDGEDFRVHSDMSFNIQGQRVYFYTAPNQINGG
jgi:uncharacterized protein YaiE (UPF0345 family)